MAKFALGIGNPDTTVISATTINDDNWHQVAATWNMTSGAMNVYVNGALNTSGPARPAPHCGLNFDHWPNAPRSRIILTAKLRMSGYITVS